MFGLDSIAAGIGAGAAIGGLSATLFGQTKPGLRTILVVVGAVLGGRLGPIFIAPELDKSFGASLRASEFDSAYASQIKPGLERQPALKRIFKEDPKVELAFKEELRKSYLAGGANGALEASVGIGARILGDVFLRYVPRSRGQDLIAYAQIMGVVLGAMETKDPEACILFLNGAKFGKPLATSRLREDIGQANMDRLDHVAGDLVAYASDKPVPFDKARGETLTKEVADRHAKLMTGKSSEVVVGNRLAADAEEAKAACAFNAAVFSDMAALPPADAETVMRNIFTN